ncbi:MAG: outer membrane lipoprotein carrier protein LolA [Deferribacterota bacterium]|nr:outer membrane lipoprotein carrier protein LolA [Deferribacterota bacterium]
MKKLICFFLILITSGLYAQEKKLINTLIQINTLKADFKQKTFLKNVGEDTYFGKLYLIKGEKILWDYSKPYAQFYLFTKDSLTIYDSMNNQLIKQSSNTLGTEKLIFKLLMEPESINDIFFIVVMDENRYKLYPKENIGLQYIELTLNGNIVKKIKSIDEQGNNTEITFDNIEINKPISEATFEKELPKDVETFSY